MGALAPVLLEFFKDWIQTGSDYHTLFAKAMDKEWATLHQPVLSQHGNVAARFSTYVNMRTEQPVPIAPQPGWPDDHILITAFSFGQPAGKLVSCPNHCTQGVNAKLGSTAKAVQLRCFNCKNKGIIDAFKTDPSSTLGRSRLTAVRFPQLPHTVPWEPPKEVEKGGSARTTPNLPPKGRSKKTSVAAVLQKPQTTSTNTPVQPPLPKVAAKSKASRSALTVPPFHPPPTGAITRSRSSHVASTRQPARPVNPDPMTRSSSLPIPSTSAIPSPTGLTIRLPRTSLTPLSTDGNRSATATPPPPSPQEPPQPRKRPPTHKPEPLFCKRPKPGQE